MSDLLDAFVYRLREALQVLSRSHKKSSKTFARIT